LATLAGSTPYGSISLSAASLTSLGSEMSAHQPPNGIELGDPETTLFGVECAEERLRRLGQQCNLTFDPDSPSLQIISLVMSHVPSEPNRISGGSFDRKKLSTHTLEVDHLPSQVQLIILTITAVEFDAVFQYLEPPTGEDKIVYALIQHNYYYVGRCGHYTVVLLAAYNAGMANTMNYVNEALQLFQCQWIINVGIAWGANPQKHRMGDVLVANQVVNLDDVKKTQGRIIQRGAHPRIDPRMNAIVNRTKQLWQEREDKNDVHIGLYVGSNTLLNDPEVKKRILEQYEEAIGGEMESFAIYEAANFGEIPWIIIK
jgi:nucleoside phosphorylase